jgi:hypothetical protein
MAQESLILDERGNPFLGAVDQIGGQTIADARTAVFVLGSLNAESLMDLNGQASVSIDARTGAGNLTFVAEGTIDGTNYFTLPLIDSELETMLKNVAVSTTLAVKYNFSCVGMRRVRIRVSVYTSGNISIAMRATFGVYYVSNRPMPTTNHVTGTAAANTALTITLAAAGAGLFHYITNITLMRNATAALAGAATLIHTSTNLPGSPAWSVGNAMVAGGTQLDLNYSPTTPLKSLAANTATTIVMPAAGAAVLNRANCSYYIGT